MIALVAALMAGSIPPAAAAGTWTVVPSATPTFSTRASIADIACVSDTSCFGVGSYVNAAGVRQLIEQWNGTGWTVAPFTSAGGSFAGIACPSTTFCMAAGGQGSRMGAAQWNGAGWAATPLVQPVGALIADVACSSSTDCFAVGGAAGAQETTLVEHWNGTAWSLVASPSVPGKDSVLTGVACTSTSFCAAVGSATDTTVDPAVADPLIEQWDGMSWSLVATSESGSGRSLGSVTCTSAMSCVAVGTDATTGSTLIKRFDGSMWTDDSSPNGSDPTADSNVLADVTCSSNTNCFAVGGASKSGAATVGILEQWNGMSWSLVANPATSPSITGYGGVTCSSTTNCLTLGARGSATQLLERWNGSSWAAAGSPVDPGTSNSGLADVACANATTCFAVGSKTTGQFPNTTTRTLIERSGASSWSAVASPNKAGATESNLDAVSCPAVTTCFAVGYAGSGGGWHTLIERWNGHTWSIVTSPNVSKSSKFITPNVLHGVSCSSTTSCFAAGTWFYNGFHTLVVQWDGNTWKVVASPNRTSGENTLSDVSCANAKNCVAVGRTSPNNSGQPGNFTTLAEHWNGTVWSIVATPNATNARGELTSVSCPSVKVCVAVGSSYRTSKRATLIESWNGASWKRVTSADPVGMTQSALSGVSCKSTTSCAAVGSAAGSAGARILVKTLAGGHWSITPSANPGGTRTSALSGVSCPTSTCFGVGGYDTDGSPRTLVERSA